jgi:hypothetical protein
MAWICSRRQNAFDHGKGGHAAAAGLGRFIQNRAIHGDGHASLPG